MSSSRFVLKQIHVRGAGSSDLARYVAKSKLNPEREGKTARALFTAHDDNLTCVEAQRWLSITGGALNKEDVLHYVLSFKNKREYELLGETDEERGREIVAFLRKALPASLREIGIEEMRWVAGIHRNTDNPHIHLLLNKNAIHRETCDLVRVPRLSAPIIAHHTRTPENQREFSYGLLIGSFAAQVDAKHRARSRFLQFENALGTIKFTRELLAPEVISARQPTKDERLVGRWIVAEIEAARPIKTLEMSRALNSATVAKIRDEVTLKEDAQESLAKLRAQVAGLDHVALERSEELPRAFIETESLHAILMTPQRGFSVAAHEQNPPLSQTHQHDFSHHKPQHSEHANHSHQADAHNERSQDLREHSRSVMPPVHTR